GVSRSSTSGAFGNSSVVPGGSGCVAPGGCTGTPSPSTACGGSPACATPTEHTITRASSLTMSPTVRGLAARGRDFTHCSRQRREAQNFAMYVTAVRIDRGIDKQPGDRAVTQAGEHVVVDQRAGVEAYREQLLAGAHRLREALRGLAGREQE